MWRYHKYNYYDGLLMKCHVTTQSIMAPLALKTISHIMILMSLCSDRYHINYKKIIVTWYGTTRVDQKTHVWYRQCSSWYTIYVCYDYLQDYRCNQYTFRHFSRINVNKVVELMIWRRKEPWHQQPWYLLCWIQLIPVIKFVWWMIPLCMWLRVGGKATTAG